MSLAITLSNALSGLVDGQSALQVTSNNVANANTVGYTRKTVDLESRLLDGIGAGVQISGVNRAVDEFLVREVRREKRLEENLILPECGLIMRIGEPHHVEAFVGEIEAPVQPPCNQAHEPHHGDHQDAGQETVLFHRVMTRR